MNVVPSGTFISRSWPCSPHLLLDPPADPLSAEYLGTDKNDLRWVRLDVAIAYTSPPLPPLPPEGPLLLAKKATLPAPPRPPLTVINASSTNIWLLYSNNVQEIIKENCYNSL